MPSGTWARRSEFAPLSDESLFPPERRFVKLRDMRRARPACFVLLFACLVLAASGCGGEKKREAPLSFEALPDTAGLTQGRPIVESFAVERMDGGALRVSGQADLPDGTRLQLAVKEPGGRTSLAMTQMSVHDRRFESPPLVGDMGPLPLATYRFEILAHFTPDWQTAEVMRATDDGRTLRGPGITRTRQGGAAFFLVEEMKR
jgi:hypothetical protein